jgi:hypothetical protein
MLCKPVIRNGRLKGAVRCSSIVNPKCVSYPPSPEATGERPFVPASRILLTYFPRRLRIYPTSPTRPVPTSSIVAGSGVGSARKAMYPMLYVAEL